MWDTFVEAIRASMFLAGHACNGSLGFGVLVVSLTLRLMLLPLTLRLAARARVHQAKMAALAPELARLRALYAKDPRRYWQEAGDLMRRHGVRPADPAAFLSLGVQAPILFALFAAVRRGLGTGVPFLWVSDLARTDVRLTLLVTLLTGISVATAPTTATQQAQAQAQVMLTVAVIGTAVFLWTTASSVALSAGAGAAVSLLQNWLVVRRTRSA
jgi:YidC/Oxa1 family membrane protein insertase